MIPFSNYLRPKFQHAKIVFLIPLYVKLQLLTFIMISFLKNDLLRQIN